MAYASIQDLAARWRLLSAAETTRATVLLDDAAVRIDAAKPPADPPTDAEVRKIVSCEMVKRAMLSNASAGITQQSQNSGGLFSQQVTYANPTGDMYLTREDKKLLGVRRQTASSVWMGQVEPEPAQ